MTPPTWSSDRHPGPPRGRLSSGIGPGWTRTRTRARFRERLLAPALAALAAAAGLPGPFARVAGLAGLVLAVLGVPFTDRPRPADRADRDSRAAATLTATRDAIVAPDGSRLAPTEVAQLTTRYEADRWALLAEDRRGREHVLLDELGSAEVEEAREAIEAVIAGG